MRQVQRVFLVLLLLFALLYAGVCVALFSFQRSLIYFPQPSSKEDGAILMPLQADAIPAFVSTRPHAGSGALIYFGGNAEDVSRDMPTFSVAFPNDAIYLLHYPGYTGHKR